jgi:hypothetical protein
MADIVDLTPFLIGTPETGVNLYQVPNASMEVLEDIINATWNLALDKSNAVTAKVDAITEAGGLLDPSLTPSVAAGTASTLSIDEPLVDIPTTAAVTDVFDTFTTEYIELATWMTTQFTGFITTYAPDNTALYTAAEDSLQAALASNTFIPPDVSDQIWTDDRDRIAADANRAQADVLDVFAAKRFPLPPGASASAIIKIQAKAQDEIAESSRKLAVMSVEQYKFVIEKAIAARDMVLKSAVDYVKALASGPDMISRMTNIGYDAQQKLISAVSSYYNARTQAKEAMVKMSQYNNSIALDAAKANQTAEIGVMEMNLKAILADLSTIAQQATAALNNLHVSVSMQAGGSTVTTQAQDIT